MNLLFEGFRQYYKRLEEELDTNVEMSNEYDSEGNQLTKAQAEFFKNSKVRDTKGRLLVLYHGTGSEFDEFDPETSWDNFGFHFGTKEAASQRNSSILMRVYLNCKNVFHIKEDLQYWDAYGFSRYFLQHPKDALKFMSQEQLDEIKESWEEWEYDGTSNDDTSSWDAEFGDMIRDILYNSKYDCIEYINGEEDVGSTSYMAFYPNQIKSIDNKTPTDKDNINESKQDTINFRDWVSNNVVKDKVDDVVSWFEKNRSRLKSPQNDYYYWIKNNDIGGLFNAMSDVKDKDRLKDAEKEGARLIYNKDGWKVYEITNYWASAKYGKNTRWCISGSKRWNNGGDGYGFWQDYHDKKGIRFFFFIKNNSEKYCIALYPNNNYEIWNQEDVPIAYIPDAPKIDEIPIDYTYNGNEMEKLLNLFVQNKLPNNLSIEIINACFNEDYPYFYLTNDADDFVSFISGDIIPDSWFENLIETGSDEDWDGDFPVEQIDNINKYTHIGMEQAESVESYYDLLREGLEDYKYFMLPSQDFGYVDIATYYEFSDVLYDIWQIYFGSGEEFFEAMQIILVNGLKRAKYYYGLDELEDIGFSKEFIDSIELEESYDISKHIVENNFKKIF